MSKKRILIIDDSEEIRVLLYEILTNAGYEVMMASDGNEGLRLFREKPVDLVITDMVMPGKMGIDVILELTQEFPQVKIIAISAGGDFGPEIELDMASICHAHTITKPFSHAQILNAVKELTTNDTTNSMALDKKENYEENDKLETEREFIDKEIDRSRRLGFSFGVLSVLVNQSVPRGISKLFPGNTISFRPLGKDLRRIDDSITKPSYRKYYVVVPQTDEKGVRFIKEEIFKLSELHKWGDILISAVVYPKDGNTSYELLCKI